MQDVDRVLAEVAGDVATVGLDPEAVRQVMVAAITGEQPLPLRRCGPEAGRSVGPPGTGAFFPE